MLKRGMFFDVIDWSEDQASLPFDEWGRTSRRWPFDRDTDVDPSRQTLMFTMRPT
jgi:hypothetical protein